MTTTRKPRDASKSRPKIHIPTTPPAGFAAWLHNRYLSWVRALGRRGSITEFAAVVVKHDRDIVNQWMRGRHAPKDPAVIRKIAAALGQEVYDALGVARPDPLQDAIIANWGQLDDDDLSTIKRIVDRFAVRPAAGAGDGAVAVHDGQRKARVGR